MPAQQQAVDVACNPVGSDFKFKLFLKSEERKADLERHRAILLATIDYIIDKIGHENLPKDNFEIIVEYYQRQKQQIEKNFQMRRLYNLRQRLNKLVEFPMRRCDLTFGKYILGKTGYDINIFEALQIRVNEIITQNEIKNKKQANDIFIILDVYKQQSAEQRKTDILKKLLINYFDKTNTTNRSDM